MRKTTNLFGTIMFIAVMALAATPRNTDAAFTVADVLPFKGKLQVSSGYADDETGWRHAEWLAPWTRFTSEKQAQWSTISNRIPTWRGITGEEVYRRSRALIVLSERKTQGAYTHPMLSLSIYTRFKSRWWTDEPTKVYRLLEKVMWHADRYDDRWSDWFQSRFEITPDLPSNDTLCTTPVPIPGAVWLLGSGLFIVASVRRATHRHKVSTMFH